MKRPGLVSVLILLALSGPVTGRAQNAMTNDQAVRAYLSGDPDMKDGPDFGMVDTALAPVSLRSLRGKYVVLDFWASWCGQCMYEYPYMEKLEAAFKGKNIEFVSVSCDEQIPVWKSAIIRHHMDGGLQWHVSDLAILRALKVARIPRFVLLDKEGRVIDSDLTRPSDPELVGYLRSLKGVLTVSGGTPCMDALRLFTGPNVPAMAPEEELAPLIPSTEAIPANLPGNGLAQHPMLYIGENCNRMSLVKDGKVIWTYNTGKGPEYDDVWMLSNGNILFTRMQYVALMTPDKKILWRYECNNASGPAHTEVHSCQPIGLDKVMFVVNGLPPKLFVVNIKTGKIEVEHELPYIHPADPADIHPQVRRCRVTARGTYLVSLLNMGRVVEYDSNFQEVWSYKSRRPWSALRLKNGNTLITDEADYRTTEVNAGGQTVWQFDCKTDLPPEFQFTSAPQSCTRLENGNTIFTSRGRNGKGPQLIEVTRDKKVVWVLHDWQTVGDATAVQILDDPGIPEIPGQSEH